MSRAEAEANLERAISEYMTARGDDGGMLIDWILVTAHHIAEDDGGTSTANGIYAPSPQRVYNALGLVEYARTIIKGRFLAGGT